MYDSEAEIKKALECLENFQDKLQDLYDSLSQAVENGRHAINVDLLTTTQVRAIQMREVAHCALTQVKEQVQDVLSAEKQFLEEDEQ